MSRALDEPASYKDKRQNLHPEGDTMHSRASSPPATLLVVFPFTYGAGTALHTLAMAGDQEQLESRTKDIQVWFRAGDLEVTGIWWHVSVSDVITFILYMFSYAAPIVHAIYSQDIRQNSASD